ncbi:MAG: pyrroline-5-carboxylate reductase dimerization domain-containing protein, partial [Pseudomonadota bacterium]
MIQRLGIIGAGHLAGFVAEGLRNAGWDGSLILPERPSAAAFAERFGAEIAATSQSVIDVADAVLVAVRPAQVDEALTDVTWPEDCLLISAMAGVKIDRLAALAHGARIVRAMPISAAIINASPTPVFPRDEVVEALFALIGAVIPMEDEAMLEVASANAAAYGWHFRLIDGLVKANVKAGLSNEAAKRIGVETLIAAARVALVGDRGGEEILKTLATPGGITAQGLALLDEADAFAPWDAAFAAVAER